MEKYVCFASFSKRSMETYGIITYDISDLLECISLLGGECRLKGVGGILMGHLIR